MASSKTYFLKNFVLYLLTLFRLVQWSAAENYYYQSQLITAFNVTTASTEAMCVAECLSRPACVAVTTCSFNSSFYCSLTYCGNLKMQKSSSCKTIVLSDITIVESFNTPVPTHEWISTDACGASGACAPNSASIYSTSATLPNSTFNTPSLSLFFGSCSNGVNSLLKTDYLTLDTDSFTLFYYVKVNTDRYNLTLSQVRLNPTTFFPIFLNFTTTSNFVLQLGTKIVSGVTIKLNQWYSLALTFSAAAKTAFVYVDSVQKMTVSFTDALPATLTMSIVLGPNIMSDSIASVYCVKLYNSSLTASDIASAASSCEAGKISYVILTNISTPIYSSTQAPTTTRCAQGATLSLDGKYYYAYISEGNKNMFDATNLCANKQQLLLKIDSVAELKYLTDNLDFSNWRGYWTSLRGNYNTGSLTWQTDNTPVLTSTFSNETLFDIDDFQPACFSINVVKSARFYDENCYTTLRTALCYCKQ